VTSLRFWLKMLFCAVVAMSVTTSVGWLVANHTYRLSWGTYTPIAISSDSYYPAATVTVGLAQDNDTQLVHMRCYFAVRRLTDLTARDLWTCAVRGNVPDHPVQIGEWMDIICPKGISCPKNNGGAK
jgi:hypothetical protein